MNGYSLAKDTTEKDLDVTVDEKLSFQSHIGNIIATANSKVGIIKRNFTYLNGKSFLLLYISLVRRVLEYGISIWYPLNTTVSDEIEKSKDV